MSSWFQREKRKALNRRRALENVAGLGLKDWPEPIGRHRQEERPRLSASASGIKFFIFIDLSQFRPNDEEGTR